jgi:hypothetical protein
VAIRFDETTLARARELAERRNTGYQTLLKEFVIERLYEEEKREGIIGRRVSGRRPGSRDSDLTAATPDGGGQRRTPRIEGRAVPSTRRTSKDAGKRVKTGL